MEHKSQKLLPDNFLVDKQGVLYENSHISIRIRQARPFKDQHSPHLKFYLTFKNTTSDSLTNFACGFKGQSKHYNLMVNTKKLAKQIPANSEVKMAFVLFPTQYPFDSPKLNISYEVDEFGDINTVSDVVKIDIPFNKFVRFVQVGQGAIFDDLPSKAGTYTRKVTLTDKNLSSLRDLPAYFPNLMDSTSRNSSNYQIIKGAFYFILNADQREYYFEAKLDANQKILYLSINSEPVSSLVTEEDEYLIPLLQKFEGFLMEKYQSLV